MVYRTTVPPIFTLRRELDRLFDDAFATRSTKAPSTWSPAVDVREETTAWNFDIDLPGVAPEQVEVTAEKGMLTVSGEKHAERQEGAEEKWYMLERVQGTFKRTFQLPENVSEERIEATFKNGVLSIRLPKTEIPAPRRIAVKAT
jgi:HSP20 family protein